MSCVEHPGAAISNGRRIYSRQTTALVEPIETVAASVGIEHAVVDETRGAERRLIPAKQQIRMVRDDGWIERGASGRSIEVVPLCNGGADTLEPAGRIDALHRIEDEC